MLVCKVGATDELTGLVGAPFVLLAVNLSDYAPAGGNDLGAEFVRPTQAKAGIRPFYLLRIDNAIMRRRRRKA